MNDLSCKPTEEEFEKWIGASHDLFEIFEGRYDAYPLSTKWIREWLEHEGFTITERDKKRLQNLIGGLDYDVFRNFKDREERADAKWRNLVAKIDGQLKLLIKSYLKSGKYRNIGFAIAPYLFTWNFQRFKEYFKRREDKFSLERYFKSLGEFLQDKKDKLRYFRGIKLISDTVVEGKIGEVFREVNGELKELGINQNEPVGTIKLLHVFAPHYFPLIDNKIARGVRLIPQRGRSLTSEDYLKWIKSTKGWLEGYFDIIEKLESEFNSSILKLMDEGLYLMSSVKLQPRVGKLGLEVK